MRKIRCILLLSLISCMCTACSKETLSGGVNKGADTVIDQTIKNESSHIYKIGEQIEVKNDSMKGKVQDQYIYCLKKATIYQNPTVAGLKQNQLQEVDYYPPYSDEPKWLNVKEEMGMQVILCDIWIKNIKQSDPMINDFFIVYETPEGELRQLGDPIYFSHHKKEAGKYYHYKLAPGKIMECQVAWSCNIKQLKNSKLYLCYSLYDEENRKLIPIDISVQKEK